MTPILWLWKTCKRCGQVLSLETESHCYRCEEVLR
jgi:hypothetical protein